MATVVNTRDLALAATVPRTVTVTIPGTIGWSGVGNDNGNKPADLADVTSNVVNGGLTVTGGGITLSSGGAIKGGQTAYATGTGWFLGYSGGAYKFSIGDAASFLKWDGAALTFSGDISGAGNITTSGGIIATGSANFRGNSAGFAITANDLGANQGGLLGLGTANGGVQGQAVGSGGVGVYGYASTGLGVRAEASSGTALKLVITSGKLLEVPAAKMSTGSGTPAFTNKPGAGSTVKWLEIYDDAGLKWWVAAVADV